MSFHSPGRIAGASRAAVFLRMTARMSSRSLVAIVRKARHVVD